MVDRAIASHVPASSLRNKLRRLRRRPFLTLWNRTKRVYLDARDRPYERRLGIRTGAVTDANRDFDAQIQSHMAIPYRVLDTIAGDLTARGIVAPRFIDIGCGLGRPLYYFADRFEDLQGFEITAPLYAAAQAQLDAVRAAHPAYARIALYHEDATTGFPLDRPAVLFLYNPFGPKPMARLCERLRAAEHEVHLYYANPALRDLLAAELGRPPDAGLHDWFDIDYYRIA